MLANVITGCRILFSAIILWVPVFSPVFYGCYLAAGFTDMIDGTIARKLGTEGEFGSKLDTIADIVFVAAAAYKILAIRLPVCRWWQRRKLLMGISKHKIYFMLPEQEYAD